MGLKIQFIIANLVLPSQSLVRIQKVPRESQGFLKGLVLGTKSKEYNKRVAISSITRKVKSILLAVCQELEQKSHVFLIMMSPRSEV